MNVVENVDLSHKARTRHVWHVQERAERGFALMLISKPVVNVA